MRGKLVVVGGGVGGVAVASAARERGWEGEVLVLDADEDAPYDRPPLSKDFLTEGTSTATMQEHWRESLDASRITLRTGCRVTGLDLDGRLLSIDGAKDVPFDNLVLAPGASPRRLPSLEGLPHVHYVNSLGTASKTRAALKTASSVVVIGGGFIGCEVASSAAKMGVKVTIVEAGPQLTGRVLPKEAASAIHRLHLRNGIDIRLGASVRSGTTEGSGLRLDLDDGSSLSADVVIVGIGTILNLGWLHGSGLSVDGGLSCEPDMSVTSRPGVYAVGDVAAWWHLGYQRRVRVEHWTTTRLQAAVVARSLNGEKVEMRSVPYVWSDQHGSHLQHLGDPDLTGVDVEEREARRGGELFVYHRQGRVVGATGLDARAEVMKLRRDLADGPQSGQD